jgi:hypothetical protein
LSISRVSLIKQFRKDMGGRLFFAGLVVALLMPAVCFVGLAAHWAMGCTGGGSSGPVTGCHFFGVEFNFIASLATPAFVAAFFTVPLGALMCIVGLVIAAFSDVRATDDVHGVFGSDGKLLSLPQASAAIAKFDRTECNMLLCSFGKNPSTSNEPLDLLQKRCIQLLISKGAYAS